MKYRITFTPVTTMNIADVGQYFTTSKPLVIKTNNKDSEIEYYTSIGLTVVQIEEKIDGEWIKL